MQTPSMDLSSSADPRSYIQQDSRLVSMRVVLFLMVEDPSGGDPCSYIQQDTRLVSMNFLLVPFLLNWHQCFPIGINFVPL